MCCEHRAPELLLGAIQYGPEVDIWSLGCTFFEMFTGCVLFRGQMSPNNQVTEVPTQLAAIFSQLGDPLETWPEAEALPNWPYMSAVHYGLTIKKRMRAAGVPLWLEGLLCDMLSPNPSRRPTICGVVSVLKQYVRIKKAARM